MDTFQVFNVAVIVSGFEVESDVGVFSVVDV